MRARLLGVWPQLSELYGIHPWDVERLTVHELNRYLHDLDDRRRAARRAQQQQRRR